MPHLKQQGIGMCRTSQCSHRPLSRSAFTGASPEVAQGLHRVLGHTVLVEHLAHCTLGIHVAQVRQPLEVEDLLLSRGAHVGDGLAVQSHTFDLQVQGKGGGVHAAGRQ